MKNIYEKHIAITDQMKHHMKDLKVVFPSYYGSLYTKFAEKNHIKLQPDELIGREALDDTMVRHILTLTAFTEDAIKAMQTKNDSLLKKILKETQQLHQEIEVLQKIVYEDDLTKCYNRKWFADIYLNRSKNHFSKNGILMMIDIDDFKYINDNLGHLVGDKVLIYISLKLKETGGDVVRYGGDEFLVLFSENISLENAQEKIRAILAYFKKVSFKAENDEFKLSFSYGIVPFFINTKLEIILDMADKEMYSLKKTKNTHYSLENRFDVSI